MVNAKAAIEGKFLKPKIVEDSPTKKAVIISGGSYVEGPFGPRLCIKINLDAVEKEWSVNSTSASNIADAYGKETDKWIGKWVDLEVEESNGKKIVVGYPCEEPGKK